MYCNAQRGNIMGKAFEEGSAKKQINTVQSEAGHESPDMKTPAESTYWNTIYPEGYGREYYNGRNKVASFKMAAEGANLNLFENKGVGFCKVVTEEVAKSTLSAASKDVLTRYAGCAWEIRAEKDDEGKSHNVFVLREDVTV
jgi:hypothetical protein